MYVHLTGIAATEARPKKTCAPYCYCKMKVPHPRENGNCRPKWSTPIHVCKTKEGKLDSWNNMEKEKVYKFSFYPYCSPALGWSSDGMRRGGLPPKLSS